ncbi:MAG: rhomboid family intramembrane serine protease [Bacteroidetes bacterium]|nr:MAG: rhomboid family intramembrane serine protease [Bacteroidota bacterium]MBL1145325.1 rhomboid family intramembrane serine protease [Bacteroidota bacterium]
MQTNPFNSFDLKFKNNNMLFKLIYINAAVFVSIILLYLPFWLMSSELNPKSFVTSWFSVPSNLMDLFIKPWTIFSYMFLHVEFMHLLFNMILLYFSGQLFVQFLGERRLLTVYIAGGIAGALLYIIAFNIFPAFQGVSHISKALGASASVMAILVALAAYMPDFIVRFMFIGNVKLKYIAAVLFIIDLAGISNANSGGHIAHIGGALLGYFFAKELKKGKDITAWVGKSSDYVLAIFKPSTKSKMKVKYKKTRTDYEYKAKKKEEQEQIDRILDKISKSGYDSLSRSEKEILFKESNK